MVAQASKAGLTTILWSVDVFDWTEPGETVIAQRVLSRVRPGSVILLHSNHEQTALVLPSIIAGLREEGYRFVSLDEWFRSMLGEGAAPARLLQPHHQTVIVVPVCAHRGDTAGCPLAAGS